MEKFDINRLRVASPCSISWNEMTGDDRTRHCDQCELNVYNVAGMTRDEVARLVEESNGRLCMRLVRRADGSVMTKDCPVGLRAYRKRLAVIASAAFAAVLGLFSVSYAQKGDSVRTVKASDLKVVTLVDPTESKSLSGSILDPNGAVIPNVRILLYRNGEEGEVEVTTSDADGRFAFRNVSTGTYSLRVEGPAGFQPLVVQDLELVLAEGKKLDLSLELVSSTETVGIMIELPIAVELPNLMKLSPELQVTPRPLKKPTKKRNK